MPKVIQISEQYMEDFLTQKMIFLHKHMFDGDLEVTQIVMVQFLIVLRMSIENLNSKIDYYFDLLAARHILHHCSQILGLFIESKIDQILASS